MQINIKKTLSVLFLASINARAIVEKDLMVSLLQERIQNRVFIHKKEICNGTLKEIWAVDGVSVTAQEYKDAVLDAEREESRSKREKKDQAQQVHDNWLLRSQQDVYIKAVQESLKLVQYELDRLTQDTRLASFFLFDKTYIASSVELDRIKEDLSQGYSMIAQKEENSFDDYIQINQKLESYPDCLQKLYQASVTYAIANSNDTKFLQELLDLSY